jgi:hypothetical protein
LFVIFVARTLREVTYSSVMRDLSIQAKRTNIQAERAITNILQTRKPITLPKHVQLLKSSDGPQRSLAKMHTMSTTTRTPWTSPLSTISLLLRLQRPTRDAP